MAKKFHSWEKFRRPELFLGELIRKFATNEILDKDESVRIWYRATVIAVDVTGGLLENPNGQGSLTHVIDGKNVEINASQGLKNPRNSVKARIITDGYDQFTSDEDLKVFWPMMPEHDMLPVKPGEHVYVTFEDTEFEHGLWFGKVPGHENVNFFKGETDFLPTSDGNLSNLFDDSSSLSNEVNDASDEVAGERFVKQNLSSLFGDS